MDMPTAFFLTALLFGASVLPAQNTPAAQQPPSNADLKESLVSFDYRLAELNGAMGAGSFEPGASGSRTSADMSATPATLST